MFTVFRSSRKPVVPRTSPASFDIEHDGVLHHIVLKRVATARRFTLRVRAVRGDIVLTMPPQGSARAARSFALRHAGWIAERVGLLRKPVPFAPETIVPFRGAMHRLTARPGLRRRVWVEADPDGMPLICVGGPGGGFADAVRVFLRSEARRDLAAAVQRHAGTVRRRVGGITLRDTKSRWGSCTSRGALNFSWRLILAPPMVLDYLAAHEVAHLVHMNHSDAFWTLAHKLAPQSREAEQWLKQNGADLHLYGGTPAPVMPPLRSE